ncbi:MAG: YggT family protein [Candidatus Omnitrophica bacterium]|nr:YggT family protein [Candidatus Omnitrophota bacterium]
MFVLANFIHALAVLVDIVLTVFYWLILFRAIISWVNPDPFNSIVQFVHRVTEPVLEPLRRFLPPMPFDISPILAFLGIIFLQSFLVRTLHDLAMRMV